MIQRIKVFISSTIGECKEERQALANLLTELNHDFFLFEAEGAYPNPPRHLYLKHLREAHIFVAIYKESYGYVARDMTVSGIEDEYLEACRLNIPKLIYISTNNTNRDERLSKLIDKIVEKDDVTYYKFTDTNDLRTTIRKNITNHIAETYLSSKTYQILENVTPEKYFKLSIGQTNFIERTNIIEEINSIFRRHSNVNLYGPAGVGKTTFLTKLASDEDYIFIPGSYLNPRDAVIKIANDLSIRIVGNPSQYNDYENALAEIVRLWENNDDIKIIIDDIENCSELTTLALDLTEINPLNRIILSSRDILECEFDKVQMTFLSGNQIESVINQTLSENDRALVEAAYKRNPEVIRNIAQTAHLGFISESFSTEHIWTQASELAQELLIYLYLADVPLSIENLIELVDRENIRASNILSSLKEVALLLRETVLGYEVASENIIDDIKELTKNTPAKLSYYCKRTARWFLNSNDYITCYKILKVINDPELPKLLGRAAIQAGAEWRQKELKDILNDQIYYSEKNDDKETLIVALLSYAQSQEYMGDFQAAKSTLDKARKINKELSDNNNYDDAIEERTLIHEAQLSLDANKFQKLEELKNYYLQHDDGLSAGRILSELCVLKMHQKDYPGAKTYAEESLKIFQELDDEYGISIAKRNLIMILQNIPEHQIEADKLLKEINRNEKINRRQRAWYCNLMTIKFRKKGAKKDYEIAEEYALEAIRIGQELEDLYIISSNLINLANVYSDQGEYEKAIEYYLDAAGKAQIIMRKDIEASASIELAEMYNYQKKYDLAKHQALYGSGLAASISGHSDRARALEQYSLACHKLGDNLVASQKALEAAMEVINLNHIVSQYYINKALLYARLIEDINMYTQILEKYYLHGKLLPKELQTPYEKLYYTTPFLISGTTEKYIIPIFGIHTHFIMNGIPALVQRRIFNKTVDQLVILKKDGLETNLFFHSLFSLLIAVNPEILIQDDLINIGDILNDNFEEISFKPGFEGEMNFWFNLQLGKVLTVSITTFDNRRDTQAASLLLVLFLMGFQKEIQKEIIMDLEFQRDELEIAVSSIEETPNDLKPFFEDALKNEYCAVPRPVSPTIDNNIPLYIVCRGDIAQNWKTATGSVTSIQILISYALAEIIYRLFEGEVELDSIRPKILEIIKDTIS